MILLNPYVIGLLAGAAIIGIGHLAKKYLTHNRVMYPAAHEVAEERVLKLVDIIAVHPSLSDNELVMALNEQNIPTVDAKLLVCFVPMAFTWIVLRKMGVSSFPSSFIAFDKSERPVELPIAREHYFASALAIANSQQVNRPTFEAIIARSDLMQSANKALAAGKDIKGTKIPPPVLLGLSAETIKAARCKAPILKD